MKRRQNPLHYLRLLPDVPGAAEARAAADQWDEVQRKINLLLAEVSLLRAEQVRIYAEASEARPSLPWKMRDVVEALRQARDQPRAQRVAGRRDTGEAHAS